MPPKQNKYEPYYVCMHAICRCRTEFRRGADKHLAFERSEALTNEFALLNQVLSPNASKDRATILFYQFEIGGVPSKTKTDVLTEDMQKHSNPNGVAYLVTHFASTVST